MTLYDGRTLHLEGNSIGVFEGPQIARYATDGQYWQFYWFEFESEGWTSPLMNQTASVSSSAQERAELERCFTSLNRASVDSCSVAESLFAYLLADWQLRAKGGARESAEAQDILTLLEKGRRERTTIPELAKEAGMCERSFRSGSGFGFCCKSYKLQNSKSNLEKARKEYRRLRDLSQQQDNQKSREKHDHI